MMRGALKFALLAILVLLGLAVTGLCPVAAEPQPDEEVQSDISTREIPIKSTFTGIEIVVFGAIDNSRIPAPGEGPYDVIMVIGGPPEAIVTRRKERVAGIWINGASQAFVTVPSFYALLSSREIDDITSTEELKTLGIGIENLRFGRSAAEGDIPADEFRDALIRLKREENLFQQHEDGVSFIGRSLFRGTVDLPAAVPVGPYTAQVFLFRDGTLLSTSESNLHVHKVGFERVVYLLAFRYPFIYGFLAVVLAVMTGLLAWAAFGRRA